MAGTDAAPRKLYAASSDPPVGPAGALYYNTTSGLVRKSNGSAWSDVGGSAGGTQRTFAFFSS